VKPRSRSGGYAILTALLVTVLAASFALVVVGVVCALQSVEGSDAAGWRATAAEPWALAAVTRSLRWWPSETSGTAEGGDPRTGGSWRVSWSPDASAVGEGWPRVTALLTTEAGRARRREDVVFDLRSEPWATGVTCVADADVAAPLAVCGSGFYLGGCLRGRENVTFVANGSATSAAVDVVRGDTFPVAAVHGGAGIFARGDEIHDSTSGPDEFPDDSDRHDGTAVPAAWLVGPTAEFLLAAGAQATSPGPALSAGVLRLDELPPALGPALVGGRCILVPMMDEVTILGSPPPRAGRLLVIVTGDAALGSPGETLTLSGGLVVEGRLDVRGPVVIAGTLHAGSLSVHAPTSVVVASTWRESPLAGAVLPTIVALGEWP
jgi:hypothetical protein